MILVSYNDESNKVTIKSTSAWFPAEVYGHSYDHIPSYPTGDDANGYFQFDSDEPGMLNIDYGDGTKEQKIFKQINDGTYRLVLGSLDLDYFKNPDTANWGSLMSGGRLTPEYPHKYADKEKKERIVTLEFTNKITNFKALKVLCDEFPVIDLPFVRMIYFSVLGMKDASIPEEKIVRADDLEHFNYSTILDRTGSGNYSLRIPFPEGILKATHLKELNLSGLVDMSDPENGPLRRIGELSNLTLLALGDGGGKPVYLKEYNDLPELTNLDISCDMNADIIFETDKINQNLTNFTFLNKTGNAALSSWRENVQGRGLEKIVEIRAEHGKNIPVGDLPEYFKEMRALKNFHGYYSFIGTKERADMFVNVMYEYVTGWDQVTMSATAKDGLRNQFYNLVFRMYDAYYPNNARPSGTYQAPSGFVQGSSNGSPSTPMEKVYALTMNYKQTWSVRPDTSTASMAEVRRVLGVRDYRYFLVIPDDGIPFVAEGDVLTPYEKRGFDTEEEAKSICASLSLSDENVVEHFKNKEGYA